MNTGGQPSCETHSMARDTVSRSTILAVEQVAGDEDGIDAPGDGLVDGAAPDLTQLEAPGGPPLGRQPAERAAEMDVGDLQER